MSAAEIARDIAASSDPHTACRLLAGYAQAQPRGEGDDPVLVDALSASRARPYGPWLRLTAALERFAAWRAGGAR